MVDRTGGSDRGVSGPRHPRDLEAWRSDVTTRGVIRRLRVAGRGFRGPQTTPSLWVGRGGPEPDIVFGFTRATGASRPALLEPVRFLPPERLAVVATFRPSTVFDWCVDEEPVTDVAAARDRLGGVRVGVSAGPYVVAGAFIDELVRGNDPRGIAAVVQHGLLTPDAPPLPVDGLLLAWTDADAAYWTDRRDDVDTVVVGSQLLHEAATTAEPAGVASGPVFLGQLHASEFSRFEALRVATSFCRGNGAVYRPHPSETDTASRWAHRWLRARGIALDDSGDPLTASTAPVVAIFSTGVLEAAARGLPAWVHHGAPPAWLEAFWDRYGMARWGSPATPAPARSPHEPARRVAATLAAFADART